MWTRYPLPVSCILEKQHHGIPYQYVCVWDEPDVICGICVERFTSKGMVEVWYMYGMGILIGKWLADQSLRRGWVHH